MLRHLGGCLLALALFWAPAGPVAQADPESSPSPVAGEVLLVDEPPLDEPVAQDSPGPEIEATPPTPGAGELTDSEAGPVPPPGEPDRADPASSAAQVGASDPAEPEVTAAEPISTDAVVAPECRVSISTAVVKTAGVDSFVWGWTVGCEPFISVTVEQSTAHGWVSFGSAEADAAGFYAVLTPDAPIGLHTYRAVVGEWASEPVTLERLPRLSAATAGVKAFDQGTNIWGTHSGGQGQTVAVEVEVSGLWRPLATATTDATGFYAALLTYGHGAVGVYRYRVNTLTSHATIVRGPEVTLTRVPRVTSSAAATKMVGVGTFTWGRVHGHSGGRVWTEVLLEAGWSRSQLTTSDTAGGFLLELTYGKFTAGTYTFRVAAESPVGVTYGSAFRIVRTAAWSSSMRATIAADVVHTYRAGCPVGPSRLTTLSMTYRDYGGTVRWGTVIVRSDLGAATRDAFKQAFDGGFRIAQMRTVDAYGGDDIKSMAANNSSAFNCRTVVGNPYRMSPHSYGHAIDINPAQNPYRAPNGTWYPTSTYATYRPSGVTGMLYSTSPMVRGLTNRGWAWYSGWDWHHFQR